MLFGLVMLNTQNITFNMSNQTETILLNRSDGWCLPGETTPSDNQSLICFREGFPLLPMICIYHAESGNFYQCFQRIGKKTTVLNLWGGRIVVGVVSDVPIAGMRKVITGHDRYYVPDLRTKLGKAHKALLASVQMPPTAQPVLEELGLYQKDCLQGNTIGWPQVFQPHDEWILSVPQPLVSVALLDHPDLVLAVEVFRPMAEVA